VVVKVRCALLAGFIFIVIVTDVLAIDCPTCPYHYCPTDIVTLIEQNIIISVPGTLPIAPFNQVNTIQEALSALDNYKIASGVTVTIQLIQNVEDYDTINITHPDGDKIRIVGNCGGSLCTIQFKPRINGVYVASGNTLGFLDNFNLVGQQSDQTAGIYAYDRGNIMCGVHITVQKFSTGVRAENSSYIKAPNIRAENNSSGGFVLNQASFIYAPNAVIDNNGYGGVVLSMSSSAYMPQSRIENNTCGVYIEHDSTIMLFESTIINNKGSGVSVVMGSSAKVKVCTISNNVGTGLYASTNGVIEATGSVVSGNNPNVYMTSGGIVFF
jgi:hypothetical protein